MFDMKSIEGLMSGPIGDFKEILKDMKEAWERAEHHAENVDRRLRIIMEHWGIEDEEKPEG